MILIEKFIGLPIASLKYFEIYSNSSNFWVLDYFEPYQVERINASILAFLSVVIFYKILNELNWNFTYKEKFLFIFIFALCSIHWSISANILWQHTFIEFFILLFLLLLIKFLKKTKIYILLIIGIIQGILFYIRPTTIFFTIIFYVLFLNLLLYKKYKLSKILYFIFIVIIGNLIFILPFAYFIYQIYGNPIGGYLTVLLNPEMKDVQFSFSNYFLNLLGILFSPNYGIFIFHPYFFILLFYFFYLITKNNNKIFLLDHSISLFLILLSTFSILSYLFFYSLNVQWTGFYNYGTRMFTELLPFFFIIFIYIWKLLKNYLKSFKVIKRILLLTIFISFIIQIYGNSSLNILGDWYCDVHRKIDYHLDINKKVWNVKDNLFFYKILNRRLPILQKETIYDGYKICSQFNVYSEHENWLFIDRNLKNKIINNDLPFLKKNKFDTEDGDLLFYYYFFISNTNYCLKIYILNSSEKKQDLDIIIKKDENIQKIKYSLNEEINVLSIPISNNKFDTRIFLYGFSKNYENFILQKISIQKANQCN